MKQISIRVMVCAWLFSACGAVVTTPTLPAPEPPTQTEVSPTPLSGVGNPAAVFAARQALAVQLNIPVERIQVDGIVPTEWPDACLGLAAPDEMCAQVITPGYRVLLRVGLAQYEYHTNQDGTSLRQAQGVSVGTPGEEARPALFWENSGCNQLSITTQACFQQQASPADLEAARTAIQDFLTALNEGDYILAAKLYGGDTSLLAGWNPDIRADLPAWLERGCTRNGLTCLLPRSLTYRGQDGEGALGFMVEYNNPDGTLFRQGSCCLEGSGLVSTAFLVRAMQEGELWLVLDLPPYVP